MDIDSVPKNESDDEYSGEELEDDDIGDQLDKKKDPNSN